MHDENELFIKQNNLHMQFKYVRYIINTMNLNSRYRIEDRYLEKYLHVYVLLLY